MKNKNGGLIIITSAMCFLPVVFGLLAYSALPDSIGIHFSSSGSVNYTVPKPLAVFGLPLLFVGINLFSKVRLFNDPKKVNHSAVLRAFSTWAVPVISILAIGDIFLTALGVSVTTGLVITVLLGLVIVFLGNYLPKSRRNYTMGIKTPWTLADTDNWNSTHRFAGYLWVLGGVLIIVLAFLPSSYVFVRALAPALICIALVVTPFIYSFVYSKKK